MPDFTREELENWGSQFPLPVHPTRLEECANKLAVKSVHLAAFALRLMDEATAEQAHKADWTARYQLMKSARAKDVEALRGLDGFFNNVPVIDEGRHGYRELTVIHTAVDHLQRMLESARARIAAWEKDNG